MKETVFVNHESHLNEGKGTNKLNNVMNVSCCLSNKPNLQMRLLY